MRHGAERVFISYRRDDAAGYAGRLEEALERALHTRLGPASVFRDVQDIALGEDFVQAIAQRLAAAQAVVVLIGPRWAGPTANTARRIDDPGDIVRLEVAAALASPARVLPVLLPGASMPAEAELPDPLKPLARRNALSLSDTHWQADVAKLVDAIGLAAPAAAPPGTAAGGTRWQVPAAIAAAALIGLALAAWRPWPAAAPTAGAAAGAASGTTASAAADVAAPYLGTWQAQVRYAWGDRHEERFVFQRHAGVLTGTASFLRVPRGIENASASPAGLLFETRTQQSMGSETRTVTHRYSAELRGQPPDERLALRLHSTGGFETLAPLEIEARRAAPVPAAEASAAGPR